MANVQFDDLRFEDFRRMAADASLSRHEKVGFPDGYREGKEWDIFCDVRTKLSRLGFVEQTVLEVGPGCAALPLYLSELCAEQRHKLLFVDSAEMLAHLPDAPHVEKLAGRFPEALGERAAALAGKVDAILAYSVIQYVFVEGSYFGFLDSCLALLSEGGELLLGDIPNITMRKRHFASSAGAAQHRAYTGRDELPQVSWSGIEAGRMDDSVVMATLARARGAGFHAWVVPQAAALPMSNRREDILIRRP